MSSIRRRFVRSSYKVFDVGEFSFGRIDPKAAKAKKRCCRALVSHCAILKLEGIVQEVVSTVLVRSIIECIS